MKDVLSNFGRDFIENARDNALFVFEGIVLGHMKSAESRALHERLANFSVDEIETLRKIAYKMVDLTMHNMLFFFEQNIGDWKISNPEEKIEDLASLSDGLCGELYTPDGWIKKFSRYEASAV